LYRDFFERSNHVTLLPSPHAPSSPPSPAEKKRSLASRWKCRPL